MKTKLIQSVPALLALLAIVFRYVSNWCIDFASCYGTWVSHVALSFTKPLYFFALYVLPVAIILVFVSRPVFNSWLKIAVWLLPLAFIFVASQPVVASFLSTDRDDAARLAAEVFAALSLILIVWKTYTSRRNGSV
ncbi:MAG: hypothetical protein WAV50_01090 [Minisyncoccia bacterium]